jgi:hypothetical protein
MPTESVFDVQALINDLRTVTRYAARAGLLSDTTTLDTLKTAEETTRGGHKPSVPALIKALDDVARVIHPITVADLTFGRDPFSPENQKRSKLFQFVLSLLALLILIVLGYSMLALQNEQDAIVAISKVQDLHPEVKLDSLRRMAQAFRTVTPANGNGNQNATMLRAEYEQELSDLRKMNALITTTYSDAQESSHLGVLPFQQLLLLWRPYGAFASESTSVSRSSTVSTADASRSSVQVTGAVAQVEGIRKSQPDVAGDSPRRDPPAAAALAPAGSASSDIEDFCVADTNDDVRLPPRYRTYPQWMKQASEDEFDDACFQIEVVSPGGTGLFPNEMLNQFGFTTEMKTRMALRAKWLLPFLYGLFGATIFLMRNVASIRTSAMEWFPMIMRLCLGGVAGIIIGWFASSTNPELSATSILSIPYATAFLVGYGIDVFFTLLDKLNRTIGELHKGRG